jgi:hypothetical protein
VLRSALTQKSRPHGYILFADFSKAFDSVNHMLLYEKAEKMGLSEGAVTAIKLLLQSANIANHIPGSPATYPIPRK